MFLFQNYSEEEDPIDNVEPVEAADDLQQTSDKQVPKSSNTVDKPCNPPPPRKKFVSPKRLAQKRKRYEDPRIKAFEILQKAVKIEKKDECAMFAEYIAEKLRKHENRTRMILQHQIHNLLFQAEMNMEEMESQPST